MGFGTTSGVFVVKIGGGARGGSGKLWQDLPAVANNVLRKERLVKSVVDRLAQLREQVKGLEAFLPEAQAQLEKAKLEPEACEFQCDYDEDLEDNGHQWQEFPSVDSDTWLAALGRLSLPDLDGWSSGFGGRRQACR